MLLKAVEEAVSVHVATNAPRVSSTVVFPRVHGPPTVWPVPTLPRVTVDAGTVMSSDPPLIVNFAVVVPEAAAWAAGASRPRPLTVRTAALSAAAMRNLGRILFGSPLSLSVCGPPPIGILRRLLIDANGPDASFSTPSEWTRPGRASVPGTREA